MYSPMASPDLDDDPRLPHLDEAATTSDPPESKDLEGTNSDGVASWVHDPEGVYARVRLLGIC